MPVVSTLTASLTAAATGAGTAATSAAAAGTTAATAATGATAAGIGGAISKGVAIAGLGLQGFGTIQQYQGAKKAEKAREDAARLDMQRRIRAQVREGQMARSQALSAGAQANAQFGSSVAQGMGAASSNTKSNIGAIQQGYQIGREMREGNSMMNLGSAISSLGGLAVGASNTIGRLGEYYTQRDRDDFIYSR